MRYLIALLVFSFMVFGSISTWADPQPEGTSADYKAHDPVKDPFAHQNKDGFPTGPGCVITPGFFEKLDKIKNSNPCASVVFNPCNPCSAKADTVDSSAVGKN